MLGSEAKQWKTIRWEVEKVRDKFSTATDLGRRRTGFDTAPERDLGEIHQAMIEKEPPSPSSCRRRRWLRAMKGHLADFATLTFKEGDSLKLAFHRPDHRQRSWSSPPAGKFYTLGADKLPGGRGHGEPIRIMVRHGKRPGHRSPPLPTIPRESCCWPPIAGNGFVVPEAEVVANTRKGKQVMNVKSPDEAARCLTGDGRPRRHHRPKNRKLLVFPLSEIPEMTRGKGVRLQRYKDGGTGRHQDVRHGSRADLAGFVRTHVYAVTGRNWRNGWGTGPVRGGWRRRGFRGRGEVWVRGPSPLEAESAV